MNNNHTKKYTTRLAIVTAVLAIATSLLAIYHPKYVSPLWVIQLLVFFGVQWLVFAYVQNFDKHDLRTRLKQYQVAKFGKMFLYLALMSLYVFTVKDKALAFSFLADFMAYYLVFTALEIRFVTRWINHIPATPESTSEATPEASSAPTTND